jgi:hypothetical protein
MSCATSESYLERVLTIEKNVAGLHESRFSLLTMEAGLRAQTAHFSQAGATYIDDRLAGCGDDDVVRAEDGSSDNESSKGRGDSDNEDS